MGDGAGGTARAQLGPEIQRDQTVSALGMARLSPYVEICSAGGRPACGSAAMPALPCHVVTCSAGQPPRRRRYGSSISRRGRIPNGLDELVCRYSAHHHRQISQQPVSAETVQLLSAMPDLGAPLLLPRCGRCWNQAPRSPQQEYVEEAHPNAVREPGCASPSTSKDQCGCGTIRRYGFGAFHSGNCLRASSSGTAGTMMTSSPFCQLTGVATL